MQFLVTLIPLRTSNHAVVVAKEPTNAAPPTAENALEERVLLSWGLKHEVLEGLPGLEGRTTN